MMAQKFNFKKRRAVSNIIGSLIVLAIVASVGSVILFQGLNQINAFNYDLTLHEKERVNELREDIILEHVRFDSSGVLPDGDNLEIYLANIGTVDTQIISVTVVKIDTQELILNREVPPVPADAYIPIEDHTVIVFEDESNFDVCCDTWDDGTYGPGTPYKITVATAKGNFFDWTRTPYNQ
jgi:flagellin-like protein